MHLEGTPITYLAHPAVETARRAICSLVLYVHFVRLATTLLKDEESARDYHVLACNFAKYSPILKKFSLADSTINLS